MGFRGHWYLFAHDADLVIGDESGAIGRRAVTVYPLRYNKDGTIRPVVQADGGVPSNQATRESK